MTILVNRLKQVYELYAKETEFKEKQQYLKEIGLIILRISKITSKITKIVVGSQLAILGEKLVNWGAQQRETLKSKTGTDGDHENLLNSIVDTLRDRVLSEFSWFPRARL